MMVVLPSNLKIDSLLKAFPPDFNFDRDRGLYILSLISWLPMVNRKYAEGDYVRLNGQILKNNGIRNFADYRHYFLSAGVLSQQPYQVGKTSFGFRFTEVYQTRLELTKPPKTRFWQCLERRSIRNRRSVSRQYYSISKWYDDNLQINVAQAERLIEKQLSEDLEAGRPNAYLRKLQMEYSLMLFKERKFVCTKDQTGRVHNPFTNMSSTLRPCLGYDGRTLVNIDIRNSQPFMSTLLFEPSFWSRDSSADICFKHLGAPHDERKGEKKIKYELVGTSETVENVSKFFSSEPGNIGYKEARLISSLMMCKNPLCLSSKDIAAFKQSVQQGRFYEDFMEAASSAHLFTKVAAFFNINKPSGLTRTDAKKAILQAFYSDNRFFHQEEAKVKRRFAELYPNVYRMFRSLKQGQKNFLALLLQSIEAKLIIGYVVPRLADEFPEMPIYTIHDSVVVPERYAEKVKALIVEEVTSRTGYTPSVHCEVWGKPKRQEAAA